MMGYDEDIRDVRVGDYVQCVVDGHLTYRRVLSKFEHVVSSVLEVQTISGQHLLCTPNHRMVTFHGKQAIRDIVAMSSLWENQAKEESGTSRDNTRPWLPRGQERTTQSSNGEKERESSLPHIPQRAHEGREESYEALTWSQGENDGFVAAAEAKRGVAAIWGAGPWEWHASNRRRSAFPGDVSSCGQGISYRNWQASARNSKCLQTRFRIPYIEDRCGNRWQFPQHGFTQAGRHEENRVASEQRLDLLQINESRGSLRADPVCSAELLTFPEMV